MTPCGGNRLKQKPRTVFSTKAIFDRLRQTDKKKYRIIARLFGNNYYLCIQNYVNNESYGRIAERQL